MCSRVIEIYCFIDDLLKAANHSDDLGYGRNSCKSGLWCLTLLTFALENPAFIGRLHVFDIERWGVSN